MFKFNVGIVVDEFAGMCILCCTSSTKIDCAKVQKVASLHLQYAKASRSTPDGVMRAVRDAVEYYCGVDVKMISADTVVTISNK